MPVNIHTIPKGMRLHPLRATDLTASDIAASQGRDPYKSALQLYAEKTGQIEAQGDNPMMQRGRWLEPAVIAALLDEEPELRIRYPLDIYLRDPLLNLGCTPDALGERRDEPGLLINIQCKVVTCSVFERDWQDEPPIGYQLQTLTEGMLTDANRSIVAALVIDNWRAELHTFPIARHAGAEEKIRAIAKTFWDNVRTGKRPKADPALDGETLAAMFPEAEAEPVLDLSADNRLADILPARALLKAEMASLKAQVDAFDTEIKDKLGPHEKATLPGWKLSWPTTHIAEHMVKASSHRRLNVTPVKEEKVA